MNDQAEGRKDIIFIAKFILGAILTGLITVLIYLGIKWEGGFLPVVWSLAFLICGAGIGFLFGIPRILTDDIVPENLPLANNAAADGRKLKSNYRPSTHLERISEWLTTLIVGLTLVQWNYVVTSFNSVSQYIAKGLNQQNPEAHLSFASALMLYFSVAGFLGAYMLTRTYLSKIFELYDVGSPLEINEVERRELNSADLSNPQNLALDSGLNKVARRILGDRLEQLTALEDVIAWSKAQLTTGNFEKAVEGYKKAVEIVPNDIQLRLEYTNALYHAGEAPTDTAKKDLYRAESEAQLLKAYSLLNRTTNPELKMKVYRAITFFYLFSDLKRKDFEKTIRFGEEFDADTDSRKIVSVGILVNLASAYAQKYKWLEHHQGSVAEKQAAREKALQFVQRTLKADRDGRWLRRLQTLLRKDISKDKEDDDLEIFERDAEFRNLLALPSIAENEKTDAVKANEEAAETAADKEKTDD